jgi:hypothetical protein
MSVRPTIDEMLAAVIQHLETNVLPALKTDARLHFQTLVAANVLKIAGRELAAGDEPARSGWLRLNDLLGESLPLPDDAGVAAALADRRNLLCADIRAGKWDEPAQLGRLLRVLIEDAEAELAISNPKLLDALRSEDAGNA